MAASAVSTSSSMAPQDSASSLSLSHVPSGVGRELVDCAVRDDLAYALDGRDEDGDETPQRLGGF